jgi:hypothetical protein
MGGERERDHDAEKEMEKERERDRERESERESKVARYTQVQINNKQLSLWRCIINNIGSHYFTTRPL